MKTMQQVKTNITGFMNENAVNGFYKQDSLYDNALIYMEKETEAMKVLLIDLENIKLSTRCSLKSWETVRKRLAA